MLTIDYKILSKVLDNRLKRVLDKIISPHQTGFMEGRNIITNIIKLLDVLCETERCQVQGVLMSIDFEKCFDMIEHQAVKGALQYFGFGSNYIKWVMTLFTKFEVCTRNNGEISNQIRPSRGLRQGCCISPHLFNLTGQIFSDLFYDTDGQINGLVVCDLLNLLSQFADDTNIYLKPEADNLNCVSHTLAITERNLGLKVNYEKSTLYQKAH